ncbi:MAG: sulfite exporter TauE/SafE family protein [Longimicrobiales bacterium]
MNPFLPYTMALLLGSMHALEADHMAAVAAFAVRRPAPRAALRFGVRWALGHGASVTVVGLLLLMVGTALPEPAAAWMDRVVGLVLIALGAWTAWHAAHLHAHSHSHHGASHVHLHSHAFRANHQHEHTATMVGVLHGLAGAAPALAVLQIARLDSVVQGIAYLAMFAVGTALGMAVYAVITGYFMDRVATASERWARWLGKLTGLGTIAIGLFWLLR